MLNHAIINCLTQYDPIPALLDHDADWIRTYGRAGRNGDATLLYERQRGAPALRTVRLGRGEQIVDGLGKIEIADWSSDEALPILADIYARHPYLEPVRYRPGKRCTFKSTGRHTYFAKVVADDRGAEIIRHGRMLWAAAQEGRLGFGVARPAGWLPSLLMIVHHALPGLPVIDVLGGEGGPALARKLGAANASLAQCGLKPQSRYDYGWQMERTAKYADRLHLWLPASASLLDEILDRLSLIEPGAADKPIHGAPHAHQWLCDGDQLYLVDFDRFGLGDPELEVATFLAEWDFETDSLTSGVGDAYFDGFASVMPLNHRLVGAYRLHKYVAKALRTLTAIRLDAAERALAILEDAAMRVRRLV
jgi:Phosphotransferase enzyme family